MKYLIFIISFLLILSACKKDESSEPTPIPVDPPSVYVPIYQPGDTSMGAAYAKKLTANWKATSSCRVQSYFDTNYISIVFLTYNNFGEQRESFGFGFIPRFGAEKSYFLKDMTSSTLKSGHVSPYYNTWTSDGDVLQDYYEIDTTAFDNHFTVTKLDLANKRIECTFTATFKIVEPRVYAANPKTVKFSNGRAWAYIRD
jgi:hypothetical protein